MISHCISYTTRLQYYVHWQADKLTNDQVTCKQVSINKYPHQLNNNGGAWMHENMK